MGLNDTPSANRVHIGFFGLRNAGKSSVVNAVTAQKLSIVSNTPGTTTDPVYKSMELLPMGPVTIIDTPGFDDVGELGEMRMEKTRQVLSKTDVAILVTDGTKKLQPTDFQLIKLFEEKEIPFIIVYNKNDLSEFQAEEKENAICVSADTGDGIHALKEKIAFLSKTAENQQRLVGDLAKENDFIVLVTPIDESAPKGRMILPQQQAIRDVLDSDAVAIVVKEFQLADTLKSLGKKAKLVITDSQVFDLVAQITPLDIPLTSFSILMAKYKGFLESAVKGVLAIDRLQDGDTVLIAEGCTHHRQCNDIGTVKIPRWLKRHTNKEIKIQTVSGTEFPTDLSPYALVIHCGGCMLNGREVVSRMHYCAQQNTPITNYGVAIAYMRGILKRSLAPFPELEKLL